MLLFMFNNLWGSLDPPIEAFDSVFCKVPESPNYQWLEIPPLNHHIRAFPSHETENNEDFLLEASAHPELMADGQVTPLFAAAQNGCVGVVRILLDAKVGATLGICFFCFGVSLTEDPTGAGICTYMNGWCLWLNFINYMFIFLSRLCGFLGVGPIFH